MTESIAKNTLTVFVAKVITSFLIFLTGILIARSFGPAGVGIYDLFIAIVNFSMILGSLGIGIASIYLLNKKKEDAARLFFHILCIGSIWGFALAGLTFLLFSSFPFLPKEFPQQYVLFAAITIPFVLLQNYLLPFLLAKFRMYQWSFFSIFYAGLTAALAFLALKVFSAGMDAVVFAVTVSSVVTVLLLAFSVFRLTSLRVSFKKTLFTQQLRVGLTSYLGDIFQVASFKLNLFFVGIFLNIAQVGYYSLALNIANVFL
ncbi:MAG: oligosaccharide flippase family protein, partial [Candidatus Wildermuthbacteria bacterium]|nr:oligosaccharide flippase family protein [Candidatus Wildermuthbacteria bacterium]